eukprot:CAMPEP_0202367950 /NCGR_PEP_ID=MMETSP1127-20130417/184_1 /ASSEMBLY_ACC=CAM_ASM_000462 /TAXON_ID=3047 /ORGANISM="Dunaliella tertiolecta, Strain CCMP1320" /LENGTH=630 /DNA_ID=CAMNT_0048963287 /DNA_START=217 /DNA_END=2110 /DNA_ORIENTATION=+
MEAVPAGRNSNISRSSSSNTLAKPGSTAAQALVTSQHTTARLIPTSLAGPSMPSTQRAQDPQWTSRSVLGLSQAMVDFTACVPESFLKQCNVEKGARRVISLQERHEVIESLDRMGCSSTVSPGGSVANTLVDVARLSAASGGPPVRVSMAGSVGTDALGCYFNAQMKKAGVNMLVDPINPSHTGTVMVLTTPDAQRSFLSFFDSGEMQLTPHLVQAISSTKMLVIEGYMLELPGAAQCLHAIASLARSQGVQVALTAGDPGVVERHRSTMQNLMSSGLVDVLFSNCEEATALLKDVVPGDGGFGSRPQNASPTSATNTNATAQSSSQEASHVGLVGASRSSSVDAAARMSLDSSSGGGDAAGGARRSLEAVRRGVVGARDSCGCEEGLRAMAEGSEPRPHDCDEGWHGAWWEKARSVGAKGSRHEDRSGTTSVGAVSVEGGSASGSGQLVMGSSGSLSSLTSSVQGQGSAGGASNSSAHIVSNNNSSSSSDAILADKGAREGMTAKDAAAMIAAHVPIVIVTDGSRGSCVGVRGQVYQLPPHLVEDPVDVCGAGDAYAAGILFAIMQGHDLCTAGQFAARTAAAVVSRHGAQLAEADAEELVRHLPNHVLLPQHWPEAGLVVVPTSAPA